MMWVVAGLVGVVSVIVDKRLIWEYKRTKSDELFRSIVAIVAMEGLLFGISVYIGVVGG